MTATSYDNDDDWLALQSRMTSLLTTQKSLEPTLQTLANRLTSTTSKLASHSSRLQRSSSDIQSSLQEAIQAETRALHDENQELAEQLDSVQRLESRREDLSRLNSELATRSKKAHEKIAEYEEIASSHLHSIQDIESNHTHQLPKIKRELTLHVALTNIKWDYTRKDVLKGEVSLMDKGVLRQFEIGRDKAEVEIADSLWGIIEG